MSGLGEIPDFILGQPLLEATGGAQRLADMNSLSLQAYYTVFDKEQQKIGFAPLKGC